MPDYKFFCSKCKEFFTAHMTAKEHAEQEAECPNCSVCKQCPLSEILSLVSLFGGRSNR